MPKRLLVVEDDPDLVRLMTHNLEREGFAVRTVNNGALALHELRRNQPDLVLLDVMLPGLDGFEICRQIRNSERLATMPVVMVTARSSEADKVVGLELGADDYVTKPFSMRELVARIRVQLRKTEQRVDLSAILRRGELTIDPKAHWVTVGTRRVELSALEFRLLHQLALHPGFVFSRDQLLDLVWGSDRAVTPRSVDVYVRRVREKLAAGPQTPAFVQTVHGVGYRFVNADAD